MNKRWKTEDLSRTYLEGVRGAIPFADKQLGLMIRIVKAWKPEVERLLDLGCGDGVLGRALLHHFPEVEAVFVDFSDPMIEAVRQKIQPDARARIVKADLSDPAWLASLGANRPFDLIVSGYSIHHLTDARKQGLYKEIFGLLGAGSVFLNMEHVASSTSPVGSLFDDYFIDSLCRYHRSVDPEMTKGQVAAKYYTRPDKKENILAPVELQCEWLRAIGFIDVDCFFKVFELALFGGRRP